jgi:hypothetical protein
MTTLSKKEKKRVRKFVQTINTQIQCEKNRSLEKFLLSHIDFVKDFTLPYKSDTNKLSKAKEPNEIIAYGFSDLFCIVKEDLFGIKEYKEIDEKSVEMVEKCHEEFEKQYPLFTMYDVSDAIVQDMQESQSEVYKKTLQQLLKKIDDIREALKRRHNIKRELTKIEWCFIKINLAVTLISLNNTSAYKKLEKLETKVQKSCKKLLKNAKKHDEAVSQLDFLEIEE